MPVTGAELIAANIQRFGGGFIKHVNKTMDTCRAMLDEEVTKNISYADHSLRDLRRMGHPYARRHGAQGIALHEPNWVVHKQSGQLISSKKSGTEEGSINFGILRASAFVGLDETIAPYAIPLIYGSWKMVPRDFMDESLNNVKKPISAFLKDNLRDFVFSFKPVKK